MKSRIDNFMPKVIFILLLAALAPVYYFVAIAESGDEIAVFDLTISKDEKHATKGDSLLISSNITNFGESETTAFYVAQVKDPSDQVIYIASSSLVLEANESRRITTPLTVEGGGAYTVQIFGWHDIDFPIGFSHLDGQWVVMGDLIGECTGSATCNKAMVGRIIDGDTLMIGGATIRLALVDTPERGERGYTEATSFTSRLCPVGSQAIVDEDDGQTEGSYGRTIAKVYCVGGMINQKLLDYHHAIILVRYCQESEFGKDAWATGYGCPTNE